MTLWYYSEKNIAYRKVAFNLNKQTNLALCPGSTAKNEIFIMNLWWGGLLGGTFPGVNFWPVGEKSRPSRRKRKPFCPPPSKKKKSFNPAHLAKPPWGRWKFKVPQVRIKLSPSNLPDREDSMLIVNFVHISHLLLAFLLLNLNGWIFDGIDHNLFY